MGSVLVDLATYASTPDSVQKLYLNESNDMYIEIGVQSKPLDPPPTTAASQRSNASSAAQNMQQNIQ